MDQPGEWYLDTKKGRLYYMPESGQNPNNQKIIAPYLNRMVYLKGNVENGTHVEYVNFKGLEFRNTTFTLGHIEARVHTDGALLLENALNCKIEECHFENIGGYALWLHLDCKNNVFHRNTVLNSGGGGVLLTGSRLSYMDDSKIYTPGEEAAKVAPYLTEITNNTVKHCGRLRYYGGGVHIDSRPASMTMLPGNYIAHNHFEDLSRNGVFAFRNQGGNVIEFNEIHNAMQTTIDGGCVHLATMTRFNAPNYILNNYCYDIWGYNQTPSGVPYRKEANGVFLDWATSNTTVRKNYTYNAGGREYKYILGNWNLTRNDNYFSKTPIVPPFIDELGTKGTMQNFVDYRKLKTIGGVIKSHDTGLVQFTGEWETMKISGQKGLFVYNCKKASPGKAASSMYKMEVKESGYYKVCLLYFPNKESASNAKIKIEYGNKSEELEWDFTKGNQYGFAVEVGKYYLEKGEPASLIISNEGANGYIVADGVGFIKVPL